LEVLQQRVDDDTVLVVTDFDLTKNGLTGLFGATIVSWCQARSIPVGDFSRANVGDLPTEPNLFELRVPTDIDAGGAFAASIFRGFRDLRSKLIAGDALVNLRSPAEILAVVLGRPDLEGQFVLYMSRLGAANSALLDRLRSAAPDSEPSSRPDMARLIAYVVGHVLVNAVLRYPGPILSASALAAYLATSEGEISAVSEMFAEARYEGPFGSDAAFYWRTGVDNRLDSEAGSSGDESFPRLEVFDIGEFNRAVVERRLGRSLAAHGCERCGGTRGGYLCPFTNRPVCERSDCSVAANSWIPAGADLCRIERDFYDEWAPLLGL
jgi:hypothetical protein